MTASRLRRGAIKTIVVLIGAFAVFFALTWKSVVHQWLWGPPQLTYTETGYQTTRERGAEIVAALEKWKATRGEYPADLAELVPIELAAIEPPLVGHGWWQYKRIAPDRFELRFFVGRIYESDWYDSAKAAWQVDR